MRRPFMVDSSLLLEGFILSLGLINDIKKGTTSYLRGQCTSNNKSTISKLEVILDDYRPNFAEVYLIRKPRTNTTNYSKLFELALGGEKKKAGHEENINPLCHDYDRLGFGHCGRLPYSTTPPIRVSESRAILGVLLTSLSSAVNWVPSVLAPADDIHCNRLNGVMTAW
ncbi:hypothetical protein RRG08_058508 [Elysia crispata]|uniref:Uncharacterized protein n=1 Tax=Elysia crispata TaxID=231223 RepID=A0AAE1DPB3_9GAST|nr:hypothetical protein RRG08_058508 [Elysia crispata]